MTDADAISGALERIRLIEKEQRKQWDAFLGGWRLEPYVRADRIRIIRHFGPKAWPVMSGLTRDRVL